MSDQTTPTPAKLTDADLARLAELATRCPGDSVIMLEKHEAAALVAEVQADRESLRPPTDEELAAFDDSTFVDPEIPKLRAELADLRAAREAEGRQAAFKAYVHKRLDDMGVPADPDSPHKAEGCRVGGRLDWVARSVTLADEAAVLAAKQLDAARADGERLRDIASSLFEWCGELRESAKHDPHLARFIEEYRAALAPRADATGETAAGPRGDGTEAKS